MATATSTEISSIRSLQDPSLKDRLQDLRKTDNLTNWYYIARSYLYLILVIGAAVWFFEYQAREGLSFWWNLPIAFVTIALVGAGQHQLSGLAHEASHHILFRNRYLNDLIGDWLTMFPLVSTLYHYRLQHHAHHQFVNDPERDPDVSQLQTSGHWLSFPVPRRVFLLTLLKQLWPSRLFRFIRIRAKYNSIGTDKNPYLKKCYQPSKKRGPLLLSAGYLFATMGLLTWLVWHGDPVLLAVLPWLPWMGIIAYFYRLPDDVYHQSRIKPLVHLRWVTMMRLTFLSLVFNALAWTTYLTGRWAAVYAIVLWVIPLFTSFAFFMILRQLVQHGNGGRAWMTNTRVFLVNPVINFAVFPLGQDYHLPHHMYASVPHYRLKELHQALLDYPEYRESCIVVDGYFLSRHRPALGPTVLDVVGPQYAPQAGSVFIDDSVLDNEQVEEKEAILQEGQTLKTCL